VIRPVGQMIAAMNRFSQQLFEAPQDTIRGISQESWYSPLQPIKPMAPAGTEPKGFQFWAGQNLLWTPRPDAELSAGDLKQLAQYPLARVCIENVKDSIGRVPWEVQLKRQPGESKKQAAKRAKGNADLVKLNKFFEHPDREHNWTEWIRPLLDDMLVIDAATILVRKTFNGEVVELPVLRGDSIVRYIDNDGYTPVPPSPAYAQIWWGIPLVDLTTDQLIYRPRNIVPRNTVSSQLYGMSPTEQMAAEIQIGIKRLEFVLAYYTEGSIPGVVQVVPRGTTPDKISEAMNWMNSELAGNLAARRQWRMVQGFAEDGKTDQIIMAKEPLLADAFDELHIRKICYAYGTSPQRLMRMMGTRNASEQQEAAELEGLIPWLIWLKGVRDHIVQRIFGFADFESTFDAAREPDPEKLANSLKTMVSCGLITENEAREDLGKEPNDTPEADMLGIVTGTGFVPLAADHQLEQQQTLGTDPESQHKRNVEVAASKPAPVVASAGRPGAVAAGKPNGKPAAASEKSAMGFAAVLDQPTELRVGYAEPLSKDAAHTIAHSVVQPKIAPAVLTPQSMLAKRRAEVVIHNRFSAMRPKAIKALKRRLLKAKNDEEKLADQIMADLEAEFNLMPDEIEDALAQAALGGASLGSIQVSITDRDMLDKVNSVAADWARRRAAEMVGMRRLADGSLIENPNAKWAITDSTRDKLMIVVRDLFAEDAPTLKDIEARIMDAGIFSDTRASMIARTEISLAQSQGNLEAWRHGGVLTVEWQLSSDHDHDDECDENEANSPFDIDSVPDCPAHPNCDCTLVLGTLAGDQPAEEE
jgi:Phage portal protein